MNRILIIALLILPLKGWSDAYPIEHVKGLIVTEAVIEGQTVFVILDTGAPGLVLNQKYYEADEALGQPCNGINGSFEVKSHQVSEWNWLGMTHKKTKALVSDLSFLERSLDKKVHALIGLSVISDFFISIDYDQRSITLTKEVPEDVSETFTRFQYANHLPVITCNVDGQKKILGLDSGSAGNYLFEFDLSSAQDRLADASPIVVIGTDNNEDIKHVLSMELQVPGSDIDFFGRFIVDLRDEGYFHDASFDGILGQEFLANYNITIHPGKQKIWLKKRNEEGSFVSMTMP